MLKNLSNFAALEVLNSEEVKGGCHFIPNPCGCGYGHGQGPIAQQTKKTKKTKKTKYTKKSKKSKKYK